MTSPDTPPSLSATPGATRPSLTGTRGGESDTLSILASVESPERELFAPARSRIRWPWIALSVLSLGVVAAYVWQPSMDPSKAQWAAAPNVIASPPVTNSLPATTPAAASAPADADAMHAVALLSEPARIETMDVPDASAPSDPFVALGAASSAAAAASMPTSVEPAVETAAKKATTKSTAVKRTTRVAAASPTKPNARKVSAKKAKPSKDADAELLAALMAHMGSEGATPNVPVSRKPVKAVDQPTIAKLVKRCESLKGQEAMQCRHRICDGYWGKAQACPVELLLD